MFHLHKNRIRFEKPFSKGTLGTIFPYQKSQDDKKWLIKHISVESIDSVLGLLPGITLDYSCDHPSILSNKGYCIEKSSAPDSYDIFVKLPRAKESLQEALQERKENNKPFTERDILKYLNSLASGLEYLHKKKISHKMLKPSNIMINEKGDVQISDIGMKSQNLHHYIAPEVFKKDGNNHDLYKADIWSLGIVIIESALLGLNNVTEQRISRPELEELVKRVGENYGNFLAELISSLVQEEPSKRPTAEEIKKQTEKALQQVQDVSATKIQQGFEVVEDQDIKKLEQENKRLNEYLEKELKRQKEQHDQEIRNLLNELEKVRKEKKKLEEEKQLAAFKRFEDDYLKSGLAPYFNLKIADQETLSITAKDFPFNNYDQALTGMTQFSNIILEKWAASGLQGQLQAIEFDFSFCSRIISDLIVAGIVEGLAKNFTGLRSLKLDFNLCEKITDQGLNCISVIIKNYLQRLTSLKLNFADCDNISDRGLVDLADALQSSVQELHYLELDFGGSGVIGGGIKSLAPVIEHHAKMLTGLDLRFYSCRQIRNQDLEALLEVMKGNCPNLNSLKLNFDSTEADSRILSELALVIGRNFDKLRSLCLDFGSCRNLTSQGMDELGIAIGRHLMKLNELELNFDHCHGLSDQGVDELCLGIGINLQALTRISLNFACCSGLSDKALQSLESFVGKKIRTLEELELYFSQCVEISDRGVTALAQNLEANLLNLKKLKICLDRCELISDPSIVTLAKTLGTYGKNLESLFLDLGACNNMGNKGVKALSTIIAREMKGLENLYLYVETPKVESKQKIASKQQLSFIKNLDFS